MEIIKARKLKYDYLKYDENGQASRKARRLWRM